MMAAKWLVATNAACAHFENLQEGDVVECFETEMVLG
jgi:hypothetical protein